MTSAPILLQQGKIDAFFFEGGTPSPLVGDLVARGAARLVPDRRQGAPPPAAARARSLPPTSIPAGLYPRHRRDRDRQQPHLVGGEGYGARPTSSTASCARCSIRPIASCSTRATAPARYIRLDEAASGLTAPLHPGAERFYREMGKLRDPAGAASGEAGVFQPGVHFGLGRASPVLHRRQRHHPLAIGLAPAAAARRHR